MSGRFEEEFRAAEQVIGQSPPAAALCNKDAEIGILTDILADNRLIDHVAEKCRAVDFSVPLYGRVFSAIVEQSGQGGAVDSVTLAPFFKHDEDWHSSKLYNVLSAATLNAGPRDRTKAYLEQIIMFSSRRRLVAGLQDVVASARNLEIGHDELIADADEAVAEIADISAGIEQAQAGTFAQAVIDSFGTPIVGVRCGVIGSLDDVAGVLRPGSFNIVAARPGMAKTATVSTYAVGAASLGHGVIFFSLEMTGDELSRRILADMCHRTFGGVPYENIRDGNLRPDQVDEVIAAKRRLDELPLEIAEPSTLSLAQLTRRVRRHRRRLKAQGHSLELVIIDYLTLMSPSRKGLSLYEHATEISRGLKALAKAESVAVIAVAQLSREVEKRNDKRPIPSDLRDSGQIEQDADLIVFLYREEEYLRREKPEGEFHPKYGQWLTDMKAVENKIEFNIAKRRNGPTGRATGYFFGAYQAVRSSDFYSQGGDHRG